MSEYQLELKQIVDYPRCRIYRQFIGLLMKDKSIRVGGTSGLYHFTVLSCFANFRTSYKRIDGISYTIYPGEWLCRVSELTEWFRTRFQHQALAILRELQDRHLITYTLLGRGRLVKFKIKGWCKYNRVLEYNAPCQKDTGFFFLPISVANELVSAGRCSEMDAMLDLWINTVYNDTQVQGSEVGPVVYEKRHRKPTHRVCGACTALGRVQGDGRTLSPQNAGARLSIYGRIPRNARHGYLPQAISFDHVPDFRCDDRQR